MAINISDFIDQAKALNEPSLTEMIQDLEDSGEDANGNSPEYRVLKEAIELLENLPEEDLGEDAIKVILKCNHPKGGVDDKVTLSKEEAEKLIAKAWAIEA